MLSSDCAFAKLAVPNKAPVISIAFVLFFREFKKADAVLFLSSSESFERLRISDAMLIFNGGNGGNGWNGGNG